MKGGLIPGQRKDARGVSNWRTGARSFWTKSVRSPPSLQAKLLRVLQEWEFERVGGNKTIQVKVRVLATTNRDLTEEVEKGNFREDLYYRLSVFPIAVPPLRERGDDILLLANTFLLRHARRHGIEKISFSKNCEKAIQSHNWPGNVRELENAVERAVILSDPGKKIEAELLGLGNLSIPVAVQEKHCKEQRRSWRASGGRVHGGCRKTPHCEGFGRL